MPALPPLRPLLALTLALAAVPAAQSAAAPPAEACLRLTDDGAWCWFSDPRAVTSAGRTYAGWVTEDGSIQVGALDHATGRAQVATLHAQFERDDHDHPVLLLLPDGRLRAFYSRHNGRGLQSRVTTRPGDIGAWEPEVTLPITDASGGTAGVTYAHPVRLAGRGDRVLLFWRGISWKPTVAESADGGATWSPARVVFSLPGLPAGNRPYAKYATNGRDRVHLALTDGHPNREATNSIYYAGCRDGSFFRADGSRIAADGELPLRPGQADRVYDAAATGVRAWIWGVAADRADRPVIVYSRLPAPGDHRYHYARWDGARWLDTELCAGGGWFPQTAPGATEREQQYSGGLALDPDDPSVVYLSRPRDGVREIERWVTPDGGRTWTSTAVTANSRHDNVRPFVVPGHAAGGPTVLWMNLSGRYRHYTDFRCSIMADLPAAASP